MTTRIAPEGGFATPVLTLVLAALILALAGMSVDLWRVASAHQRLVAARKLGLKTVPVVFLDLPPEQAKLLNLALNRISGEWEQELLARVLAELDGAGGKPAHVVISLFRRHPIHSNIAPPPVEFCSLRRAPSSRITGLPGRRGQVNSAVWERTRRFPPNRQM